MVDIVVCTTIYHIVESKTEVYCNGCKSDTYYYIKIHDKCLCPNCAIAYFVEPTCDCGNRLQGTLDLETGICKDCR